jgi:hypothetical protein
MTRRAAAFAFVLFAAAAGIAAPARAQVSSYDDYRSQLGNYLERASVLIEKIADVGDLGRDWMQFKQTVETFGRSTQGIGHLGPETRIQTIRTSGARRTETSSSMRGPISRQNGRNSERAR